MNSGGGQVARTLRPDCDGHSHRVTQPATAYGLTAYGYANCMANWYSLGPAQHRHAPTQTARMQGRAGGIGGNRMTNEARPATPTTQSLNDSMTLHTSAGQNGQRGRSNRSKRCMYAKRSAASVDQWDGWLLLRCVRVGD
eukprot:506761-Prymnesium_polylepis.1